MASELQHIDDFFRKKNEASSIDESATNLHWEQMADMLQSQPVLPARKPASLLRPFLKYAAILILVSSLMYIAISKPWKNKSITPAITTTTKKELRLQGKDIAASPVNAITHPQPLQTAKKRVSKKNSLQKTKPGSAPVNNIPIIPDTAAIPPKEDQPDNATVFAAFYEDLKKTSQEFVIDPGRDTTIYCKEGTTLFIPAFCFQSLSGVAISGMVKMQVQEFYNLSDIVGNKLTTLSNGRPLVTGGMLHIKASASNEDVLIKPGSAINLKMPTRTFDPKMQLFVGNGNPADPAMLAYAVSEKKIDQASLVLQDSTDTFTTKIENRTQRDTLGMQVSGINWMAAGQQQFFLNEKKKNITILNISDNPYEVRMYKNNTKVLGKFRIPFDADISTEKMREELEKRYSIHYDKIKVKRQWKPLSKRTRKILENAVIDFYDSHMVADSITIPLAIARRMKLVSQEDSIQYEAKWLKQYQDALKRKEAYSEFLQIKDHYDFRIANMGWINCDRFYNFPPSSLTEFVVNTGRGFEGTYFQAVLLLERENSAMPGYWNNGNISFTSLPVGENVNVICVGAKEGKVFSSIQRFTVSKGEKTVLEFKETNPEEFKRALARFGNVKTK